MNKEAFISAITSLLILLLVITEFAVLVMANPLPAIDPAIIIRNPQNTTYYTNTIILNFTASSTWIFSSVYYSIDGSDKVAINTTTVLLEDANIGKNPSISRTTVEGNYALSNVSKGCHNITLYLICENEVFSYYETYYKGDVIASETVSFFVDAPIISTSLPTAFPIIEVSTLIVTILIVLCFLLYYKKRKNKLA